MTEPAGYFVDTKDGKGDVFICADCVNEHGLAKSLERSLSMQSFVFLPMNCAIHLLGGKAGDYAHE